MAKPTEPKPVKLICGMIASREDLFDIATTALSDAFGPVDITSEILPFDLTEYYADDMGGSLWRKFIAFDTLACPQSLADAKHQTNAIEARFAEESDNAPARPINLDVGYVTSSKLVLASMKDFTHRIYLGQGVYAEVTLLYRQGHWEPLEWTFPDYALGRYDTFLTAARTRLREQWRQEQDGC